MIQIPQTHKFSIGHRTLLVSGNDDKSQQISKRLWYEMQKVNCLENTYVVVSVVIFDWTN